MLVWIGVALLLCYVFVGCAYVRDQDVGSALKGSQGQVDALKLQLEQKQNENLKLIAENAVLRALADQEFKIKLDPIEISSIPIQLTIKFPDGTEQSVPVRETQAKSKEERPSQKIR